MTAILITIVATVVAVLAFQRAAVWLAVSAPRSPYGEERWFDHLGDYAYELCYHLGWSFPVGEPDLVEGLDRYPEDGSNPNIQFISRIVVPTEYAREQVVRAIRYLHDSDIDTEYMAVNEIVHCYTDNRGEPSDHPPLIVVDPNA